MNKSIVVALVSLAAGCATPVPPGYVGVKVYAYGTDKGVDHEVVGPGRYVLTANEQLFLFPTFEQNPKYKNDTDGIKDEAGAPLSFQTREGLSVEGDFSVTYRIERENVAIIFQKYRAGIDEINRGPLRNMLRDALNETAATYPVEAIYGEKKAKLLAEVERVVSERAAASGVTVSKVSVLGAIRLPPQVTAALDAKITATQRAEQSENEVRQAEAESAKKIATAKGDAEAALTAAKAQAEANRILARSLSAEVIEYQRLQIERTRAEKWDGKLPTITGGVTPFFQVEKP